MAGKLLVSIGMPVYNGAQFICRALDSLLSQSYEGFELIISDNASTDATKKICMEYANKDKRIRYYENKTNIGVSENFNRVFDLSLGEYFMWAAHDDYWDLSYLETCLKTLATSNSIVLVGTICKSIDPDTNQLILTDKGFSTSGLNPCQSFICYKSTIHSGGHIGGVFHGLYRKNILKIIMPLRKVIGADHLLLAELSLLGEIITVQKPLFYKRWGGASRNVKQNTAAMGIKNWFLVTAPYLFREYFFQRIIFKSYNLSNLQKVKLSMWSFYNYLVINLVRMTFMRCKTFIKHVIVKYSEWIHQA